MERLYAYSFKKKSMKNKFIVVSPKMEKQQHLVAKLVHICCFILPPTDHHLKLIEQEQLLKNMTEHVLPYLIKSDKFLFLGWNVRSN